MLGKADTTVDMQIKNTVSNYTFQGLLKRQKIDLNRVSGKSLIFLLRSSILVRGIY